MSDSTDWLGLEPRILARLQAVLPPEVKVLSAADLAGVVENSQATPAVQIYYDGYRLIDEQANGGVQMVEQTWLAVVVVRNAAGQRDGKATRQSASTLCNDVFKALLGHRLGAPYTALKLANAPRAAWSKGGFGYIPLGFTSRLSVRGELQRPQ